MRVELKRGIWGGVAVAALVVSLPLTVFGLRWLNELLPSPQDTCRLPVPVLAASAGDGEVTLRWERAIGQSGIVEAWQYQQAVQGEAWSVKRSTGSAASVYVVAGLTNGLAYTFQVRAQLDSGSGCWSDPVSVVPRRTDDVMTEIEKHQRAIAGSMADVVKSMADNHELLTTLGEQRIAKLEAIATSTSKIAEHSAGTQARILQVAGQVEAAGKLVATATDAVAERAAEIRNEVAEVEASVDAAGQKIASELAEIKAQLREKCDGCGAFPGDCQSLGTAFFGHGSQVIEHMKWDEVALHDVSEQDGGWFLNVGYATSVGYVVHNLDLSDRRAACVSRCLDNRFGGEKFAFMEIARGEVLDVNDPEGTGDDSRKNRRVDVSFCRADSGGGPSTQSRDPVWPSADMCGCSSVEVST